ncbi:hypothetical protein, variant [Spizellomyces punctatus DAOM BR117]|nr:hypothetical protein, variant [Spizellomyces punctatus DAOM BR117]KNC98697.1 hypothetical protein, variant [Spizellomyces punctatus DAOM BR117]|eukprot:XP_016606737.1 hypothetical protein, variant [Spizellomyces punctatus DAOM BR117]
MERELREEFGTHRTAGHDFSNGFSLSFDVERQASYGGDRFSKLIEREIGDVERDFYRSEGRSAGSSPILYDDAGVKTIDEESVLEFERGGSPFDDEGVKGLEMEMGTMRIRTPSPDLRTVGESPKSTARSHVVVKEEFMQAPDSNINNESRRGVSRSPLPRFSPQSSSPSIQQYRLSQSPTREPPRSFSRLSDNIPIKPGVSISFAEPSFPEHIRAESRSDENDPFQGSAPVEAEHRAVHRDVLGEDTPRSPSSLDLLPGGTGPASPPVELPSGLRMSMADILDDVTPTFRTVPSYSDPFDGIHRHLPLVNVPEDSNTRAVVNALRTLQERVGKLEGEKVAAKEKIAKLEDELTRTRGLVLFEQGRLKESHSAKHVETKKIDIGSDLHSQIPDKDLLDQLKIENQLHSLKMRSEILQRQLERSKETALEVELERNRVVEQLEAARREVKELKRAMESTQDGDGKQAKVDQARVLNDGVKEEVRTATHDTKLTGRQQASPQRSNPLPQRSHQDKRSPQRSSTRASPSKRNPSPTRPKSVSPRKPSPTRPPSTDLFSRSIRSDAPSLTEDSFLHPEEIDALQKEIERERVERLNHDGGRVSREDRDRLRKLVVGQVRLGRNGKVEVRKGERKVTTQHTRDGVNPVWKKIEIGRPRQKLVPTSGIKPRVVIKSPPRNGTLFCTHGSKDERGVVKGVVGGRQMPFIIGTSTSKSYSVTANIQRVFSLLKAHNPALCSVCSRRDKPQKDKDEITVHRTVKPTDQPHTTGKSTQTLGEPWDDHASFHDEMLSTDGGVEILKKVLKGLEEEFEALKRHYHTLVQKYDSAAAQTTTNPTPPPTLRALGDRLRQCIQSMDTKGDQIRILREILRGVGGHLQRVHTGEPKARKKDREDVLERRVKKEGHASGVDSLSLLKSSRKVQEALAVGLG